MKKLMQAQLKIMQTLHNAAVAENRELTEDEQTKYNVAKAEFERLQKLQDQADELATLNQAIPVEAIPEPNPTNNGGAPKKEPAPVAKSVSVHGNREAKTPFNNVGEILQNVFKAKVNNDPLAQETIKNNLNTETGADGGVFIPTQFIGDLMQKAEHASQLYSRCRKFDITSNAVSMPGLDETSRADGSRFGGIQFSWVAEGGQGSYTYPKFRPVELKLGKLLGLTAITEELLADAAALTSWVKMAFPTEMAFSLDQAIFDGDGNGKPLGIKNCGALVTVAKETGQTADTIVYENVINMRARMPYSRRANAVWLVTEQAEQQLSLMNLAVGTGGSAVFIPAGGASAEPYDKLFGRPVIPIEHATALGDLGDIMFVDLSDYIVIEKGGIRTDSSIHVYFDTDVRAFRFVKRVNGAPYTRSAIASRANSSFTTSPYITLAERA